MVFFHTHVVLLWRTQTSRIVRLLVTQLSCFRDYVLQRVDNVFHWQVPFNDSESNHCQPLRVIFYPFAFQRFSHFQCSSHWARNEVCPCACGCLHCRHVVCCRRCVEWRRSWCASACFRPWPTNFEKETKTFDQRNQAEQRSRPLCPVANHIGWWLPVQTEDMQSSIPWTDHVGGIEPICPWMAFLGQIGSRQNCTLEVLIRFVWFWVWCWSKCLRMMMWLSNVSKAFDRIKALIAQSGEDHYTAWTLLGMNVCLKTWIRLHSMGASFCWPWPVYSNQRVWTGCP